MYCIDTPGVPESSDAGGSALMLERTRKHDLEGNGLHFLLVPYLVMIRLPGTFSPVASITLIIDLLIGARQLPQRQPEKRPLNI